VTTWPIYLRNQDVFLGSTLRWPAGGNPRRALVYSHGWGGRRDAPHHADLLDALGAAGIASISLDQRGYFDSTGARALAAWPEDMIALVDWLRDRGIADIWVGGLSTGGTMAIVTAARDPRVHGAIALSPFASLARVLAERPDRAEFLADRFGGLGPATMATGDALAVVGQIAPRRLLIVNARDDGEFSADHGESLHDAAGASSTLWRLDTAGHTLIGTDRAALFRRIIDWIEVA
jgi:dipeptidyl aminopeptidase/acylaminoacyl peptidase